MSWSSRPPAFNFFRRDYWLGQADGRPLALFRIALGLLLLKDALFHIPLATLLYSDVGMLPRAVLLAGPLRTGRVALLDYLDAPWSVTLFFLVWAGVALAILLGYRTRLATLVNYILLLAVHYRNPDVLNGADDLLRALSFWAIFLRLDTHYAVRAAPTPLAPRFPWRLAQLQMVLLYLTAALFKIRSGAWLGGDALHYTFQLSSRTWPLADWLLQLPDIFVLLASAATVFVELAFPLLVLAPIAQPILRLYGLALAVLLHVGISLTLAIPNFTAVIVASYFLFWEPEWVVWLVRKLGWPVEPVEPSVALPAISIAQRAGFAVAALAFGSILWVNLRAVGQPWFPVVREPARSIVLWTGQLQRWNMFASGGPREDSWVTAVGVDGDGRQIDLLSGEPGPPQQPDWRWGPGARWLKLQENLAEAGEGRLAAWAGYLCRRYVAAGRPVTAVVIELYRRPSYPPGGKPGAIYMPTTLWQGACPP